MAEPAHVFTLHRYYMWSTILKGHFDAAIAGYVSRGEPFSMATDEGIVTYAYMSYWYASLWVVVEGWQKLDLHDQEIDGLLDSPNVERLKLYRHSVFHFHEDYFSKPALAIVASDDTPVEWTRALSSAFGRWFLEHRSLESLWKGDLTTEDQ